MAMPTQALGQELDDKKEPVPAPIRGDLKPAAGSRSVFLNLVPYRNEKQRKVRPTQVKINANRAIPWEESRGAEGPRDPLAGLDENQRKAYEIDALGREIRDRQLRICLLMRLFAIDEENYLMGKKSWSSNGGKE